MGQVPSKYGVQDTNIHIPRQRLTCCVHLCVSFCRRLVLSSKRVGGEHNMMPSVPVLRDPDCRGVITPNKPEKSGLCICRSGRSGLLLVVPVK